MIRSPEGERYGIAREPRRTGTSIAAAYDTFSQSAGALAGKTADIGGTWSGAGDADDFSIDATNHLLQRTAVSDSAANNGRYARLGSGTPTDTTVQVDINYPQPFHLMDRQGVFARYVDTNNWLMAYVVFTTPALYLTKRKAGTETQIGSFPFPFGFYGTWQTLQLYVGSDGTINVYQAPQGSSLGSPLISVAGGADFQVGGTLANGGYGIYDAKTDSGALTRQYDNFYVSTTAAVSQAAIFSGQELEFRSDDTIGTDSTGTYQHRPSIVRGPGIFIPCAGADNRVSHVVGLARRADIQNEPSPDMNDSLKIQIGITPRYLTPR